MANAFGLATGAGSGLSPEDYHAAMQGLGNAVSMQTILAYKDAYQKGLSPAMTTLAKKITDYEGVHGAPAPVSWLLQQQQYNQMLYQTAQTLSTYTSQVTNIITDAKTQAVALSQQASATLIGSFASLPPGVVEGIIANSSVTGTPLATLLAGYNDDVADGIKSALINHAIMGKSVEETAAAIHGVLQGPLTKSLTLARTETARAYTSASLEGYRAAPKGMLQGWTWLTAEDEKVCPFCGPQDKTHHPLEEEMDTHPNCRCAMSPWVNDAFDGKVDTTAGDAAAQLAAAQPTYPAWSNGKDPAGFWPTKDEFDALTTAQKHDLASAHGFSIGNKSAKNLWEQIVKQGIKSGDYDASMHPGSVNKPKPPAAPQLSSAEAKVNDPNYKFPKNSAELNALPEAERNAIIKKLTGKDVTAFASAKDAWILAKQNPDWLKQQGITPPAPKPVQPQGFTPYRSYMYPPAPGEYYNNTYDQAKAWAKNYWDYNALSTAELKAIASYTGGGFRSLNSYGRSGNVTPTMKALDKALMTNGGTPTDMAVFRGTGLSAFGGAPPQVGAVHQDGGYMSAGASADSAWTKKAIITFHVPKGTPGAYVDPVSTCRGENEYLLGRGLHYVINDVRYEGGVYYVDATIIPDPQKGP